MFDCHFLPKKPVDRNRYLLRCATGRQGQAARTAAEAARRKAEQEARLAKALRDNLRRRKAPPLKSDKP